MLGKPVDAPVRVDGLPIAHNARLIDVLVEGATVEIGSSPDREHRPPAAVDVVWLMGPDSGRRVGLAPGRHVVGRSASGPLCTSDPAMAPRHALIEITDDGAISVTDLGVGRPVEVDGVPIAGTCHVGRGARIGVGATVIEPTAPSVRPGRDVAISSVVPGRRHGWTHAYVRPPRRLPTRDDTSVEAPSAERDVGGGPGVIGVLSTVVSLVGGLAMAALFRQPLFLVMVALGAAGGAVTWIVQASQVRRGRRTARRERLSALREFDAAVHARWRAATDAAAAYPTLEALVAAAEAGDALWSRRPAHGDAFTVTIGIGDVRWEPPVVMPVGAGPSTDPDVAAVVERFTVLPNVPVTMDITAATAIGVVGDPLMSRAVVRSMIAQLAITTGPVDWELLVAVPDEAAQDWSWAALLPAAATPAIVRHGDLDAAVRDRMAVEESVRRLVVVVDGASPLAARTSPLRRLFAARADTTSLLVIAPDSLQLPAICGTVIEAAAEGSVSLCEPGELPQRAHIIGCSPDLAGRVAATLARWSDPELESGDAGLPASVELLDLIGDDLGPGAIAARWAAAGADPAPATPIGSAADGVVEIDLVADGPHALVAGTTGAGKSELLRSMVAGLALGASPEALSFLLVDYKGGSAFDACARLPHVVGVVTDLDGRLAERVIRGLEAELRRRERLLREVGATDLTHYRSCHPAEPIARLVVVIDEFAALAAELPDFLHTLVGVAQRGRSLGVHLVLATQRPSGVLSDDIRANTNLRIALRVQDAGDATDVVGDRRPASFARNAPGRAALRLGAEELVILQAARCTGPARSDASVKRPLLARLGTADPVQAHRAAGPTMLDEIVRAVEQAAALGGLRPPHRPWLAPLPTDLPSGELPAGAIGRADDPDHQAQMPYSWDPTDGHLLLAGALGSGTTTALLSTAGALTARCPAADLHLYAIDAGSGNGLAPLERLPHTGAVVRLGDLARRRRMLHRLDRLLDERGTGVEVAGPTIVLLVDGFTSVRATLLDGDDATEMACFERIVQDGPRHGIVIAATIDQPSAAPLPLLARAAERLLFRLADPGEALALGVASASVPAASAPPGRCVIATTGLELQIARPELTVVPPPSDSHAAGGPEPIAERPAVLSIDDVAVVPVRAAAGIRLPVGVGDASGEAELLHLHPGDHVAVLGPPRSGRTTALVTLASQWRCAVADGWVGVVAPRAQPGGSTVWRSATGFDAVHDQPSERLLADLDAALACGPALLVVDDAELVSDDSGALARLLAANHAHLQVFVAGRPDALRGAYGHWTTAVRRSRKGLLLGALHDLDGDLLGVLLPRRTAHRPRPGDGYLVADGTVTALQVAVSEPVAA